MLAGTVAAEPVERLVPSGDEVHPNPGSQVGGGKHLPPRGRPTCDGRHRGLMCIAGTRRCPQLVGGTRSLDRPNICLTTSGSGARFGRPTSQLPRRNAAEDALPRVELRVLGETTPTTLRPSRSGCRRPVLAPLSRANSQRGRTYDRVPRARASRGSDPHAPTAHMPCTWPGTRCFSRLSFHASQPGG